MENDDILSIFIDESGNFGDPNDPARLCIITFVFHCQPTDISNAIRELNQANSDLGLDPEKFQFHTSPLIRQDDDFICTMRLIELRLESGQPLNRAETRFFGGLRDFKRNVLRKMKTKEI